MQRLVMDELVLSSEHYAFGYSNMLLTYCSTSRQRNVKKLRRKPVGPSSMTNGTRVPRSGDENWSAVDSAKVSSVVMASPGLDKPSDGIGARKGD